MKKKEEFGVATKAVVYKDGKFLVVKKSKDEDIAPDTYDIPGGRLVFKEELEDALKREVKEEVNLTVDIIKPTNAWSFLAKDNFQLVGITYLCKFLKGEIKLAKEHVAFEWLTLEEIEKRDFPKWFKKEFELANEALKTVG